MAAEGKNAHLVRKRTNLKDYPQYEALSTPSVAHFFRILALTKGPQVLRPDAQNGLAVQRMDLARGATTGIIHRELAVTVCTQEMAACSPNHPPGRGHALMAADAVLVGARAQDLLAAAAGEWR